MSLKRTEPETAARSSTPGFGRGSDPDEAENIAKLD
jgi:hypothetical protein